MITGTMDFMYKNKHQLLPFEATSTKLTINDAYLIALFEQSNIDLTDVDASHFDITVSAERDTLVIEDITLFRKVHIHSFSNTKASFGLLVIHNIEAMITGAYIDIFRTECNFIHISRSSIRSFDYSLKESEAYRDMGHELITGDLLELNYVTIEKMTLYKSVKELIIKSAIIDLLDIDNLAQSTFDFINITWNTHIEEFSVAGSIKRLRIKNSIVNKLNFKKAFMEKVDNKKSDINMVFMLDMDMIGIKNRSAWELLFKSAIHDDNDALYAKAGYEINHLRYKDQSLFSRLSGDILRFTIGYGYRPYRAIGFSIIAISLFALIYMVLELMTTKGFQTPTNIHQLLNQYFDMWYLSGTAYTTTGFGDIVPSNAPTKILVIFEAMVGVSALSLFMYSLLNRYGKKS